MYLPDRLVQRKLGQVNQIFSRASSKIPFCIIYMKQTVLQRQCKCKYHH